MKVRQTKKLECGFFGEGQRLHATHLPELGNENVGRTREREFSGRVFQADLPRRDGAQENLVSRRFVEFFRLL